MFKIGFERNNMRYGAYTQDLYSNCLNFNKNNGSSSVIDRSNEDF